MTTDPIRPDRNPERFPPESTRLLLAGPAGDLDALIDVPAPEDECGATAIICQPIADGGTMHNKVVHIIERSLRELGARTVRFNFRGVGDSSGHYDQGFGETDDLLAVTDWVRRVRPDDELWLGGYGFGAWIALRAVERIDPTQMVLVAPPVDRYEFEGLAEPSCSWLVVQGEDDELTSAEAVATWTEQLERPPQLLRMENADHAFHRRLMDLRGAIKNGVRRQRRAESDDA